MFAVALIAVLGALPVQEAPALDVTITVRPESPMLGEPVRIHTVVKNTGSAPVALFAGLKLTSPDVFIVEAGGAGELKFERLDRGREPSGSEEKLSLAPGRSYERHDLLNEDGRSGGFVFPKAGTFQLKVMVQGAESKPVLVIVTEPGEKEQEAVEAIRKGGLNRFWGLLPRAEDYKPEVAADLGAFIKKFHASKYRRFAAFALADYWRRFDTQVAAKESAADSAQRRFRMIELFREAARASALAPESDIGRGIVHRLLGHPQEAASLLSSALKKRTAAPWFAHVAEIELQAVMAKRNEK
jgi:hypothetical protein